MSDSIPEVSVIIPAYQAESFLAATLESVRLQLFTDFEVIVVDDGSTDQTRQIAAEYQHRDPRFRVIFQPNQGVSAARNLGFANSRGKYIAFLDADDLWLEDNLQAKVNLLKQSDAGMVHSDGAYMDSMGNLLGGAMCGKSGNLLQGLLLRQETQVPGPSSVLIRRDVVVATGDFDRRLSTSADYDYFVRIAQNFPIVRIPRVTWYYRKHPANMHMNIARMEHDMLMIMAKYDQLEIFPSQTLRQKFRTNVLMMLGASWWGDGQNKKKGIQFILRAIINQPTVIFKIISKGGTKFMSKVTGN